MLQSGAKTTLLDLLVGDDNHPALVAPERPVLTYRQLRENVVQLAAQLNSFGLGRGDRIAIAMANGPEMIVTFFAAAMCGTAAPLNPKYKQEELINRGGEKISPLEVDNVLLRHPAVAESLAFAVPHLTLGQDIHAAVVLNGEVSEQELRSHCLALLAEFKVPRQFHILDQLPRGATGKLQRINMAKLLNLAGE